MKLEEKRGKIYIQEEQNFGDCLDFQDCIAHVSLAWCCIEPNDFIDGSVENW